MTVAAAVSPRMIFLVLKASLAKDLLPPFTPPPRILFYTEFSRTGRPSMWCLPVFPGQTQHIYQHHVGTQPRTYHLGRAAIISHTTELCAFFHQSNSFRRSDFRALTKICTIHTKPFKTVFITFCKPAYVRNIPNPVSSDFFSASIRRRQNTLGCYRFWYNLEDFWLGRIFGEATGPYLYHASIRSRTGAEN